MIMDIFETLFSLELTLSFIPIEAHIDITVGNLRGPSMLGIVGIVFRIVAGLVSHIAREGKEDSLATIFGIPSLFVLVKPKLNLVRISKRTVCIQSFMNCFKMTGIAAEIVSIFEIIHLSELIFVKFHVIQLVIIKIKCVALPGYLLKILLITELIMHPNPVINGYLMPMLTLNHMKVGGHPHYTMLCHFYL